MVYSAQGDAIYSRLDWVFYRRDSAGRGDSDIKLCEDGGVSAAGVAEYSVCKTCICSTAFAVAE
jgi:hypothetical protein